MSGSYWRLDAPTDERAISFTIEARAADIRRFARDKTWTIKGTVDAEGLALGAARSKARCCSACPTSGACPTASSFKGDDGQRYELSGQKELTAPRAHGVDDVSCP